MKVFKVGFRKYIVFVNGISEKKLIDLKNGLSSFFPKIKFCIINGDKK